MKELNCCARCGQPLDLVDEYCAEDKSANWLNNEEYCPRCYTDLVEMGRS